MRELPRATFPESIHFFRSVIFPPVAKGVIIRRPRAVRAASMLDLDTRAVRYMQRLRDKYQSGPLLIGRYAVVLSPDHVRRVLAETPQPFATETPEKRAALAHFEPNNVLISRGPERVGRRRFHEQALDTGHAEHRLGSSFIAVVRDEAKRLIDLAKESRVLTWDMFDEVWARIVRLVIFGEVAREDRHLTLLMKRLRQHANWAFFHHRSRSKLGELRGHINSLLLRAQPGSLAGLVATLPVTATTAPADQIPQWLFAFDAAGMTTFRTLALLSTHSTFAERDLLRECLLDTVRLWPTTPLILRESETETEWESGTMRARRTIIIYVPFFHRDETRLPFAHRFAPGEWRDDAASRWPLIPFSDGPASCPGLDLVLFLGSEMLDALMSAAKFTIASTHELDPDKPLPGTFDHFALTFDVT